MGLLDDDFPFQAGVAFDDEGFAVAVCFGRPLRCAEGIVRVPFPALVGEGSLAVAEGGDGVERAGIVSKFENGLQTPGFGGDSGVVGAEGNGTVVGGSE